MKFLQGKDAAEETYRCTVRSDDYSSGQTGKSGRASWTGFSRAKMESVFVLRLGFLHVFFLASDGLNSAASIEVTNFVLIIWNGSQNMCSDEVFSSNY